MIYLDHAATTKPLPEALEAFQAACGLWGNPSSAHPMGKSAKALLDKARELVAGALSVSIEAVFFTSGGTEANNTAIFGSAAKTRKRHIVTTTLEHPSVREPMRELALRGFEVTYVTPGNDGRIHASDISSAVREDTFLVSCALVCNETGALSDLAAISNAVKDKNPGVLLHTDAVQGFLHVPIKPMDMDLDMVSVSAHKVGGVKGAGALVVKPEIKLTPILFGGGQEAGLRSGTESIPAICAFGAAVKAHTNPESSIKEYALSVLSDIGAYIIPSHDAPHIIAFALKGIPGEVAVRMLGDSGICISTGAACSRGKRSPSVASLKLPAGTLDSVLRISFSYETTKLEIEKLGDALKVVVGRFGG